MNHRRHTAVLAWLDVYFFSMSHFSLHRLTAFAVVCSLAAASAWADTNAAAETEDTTARYQLTYNWQHHDAFRAAYSGANSLSPQSERMYTFSTTAHWGFRPWQDGELYFNPEVTSGIPFSGNLVGLGGFTNGEITRAGGSPPKLFRQRLQSAQQVTFAGVWRSISIATSPSSGARRDLPARLRSIRYSRLLC